MLVMATPFGNRAPGERYTSVEIGDVGFVRQGYFHRLFNILLPEDHPSHQVQPNNLRSKGVSDRSDEHRLGAAG